MLKSFQNREYIENGAVHRTVTVPARHGQREWRTNEGKKNEVTRDGRNKKTRFIIFICIYINYSYYNTVRYSYFEA